MSDDQVLAEPGNQTRRALLAGAGAVGAAAVLAGCGSDDSGHAAAGPTSPAQSGQPVAKTGEIPVGGGKIFADRDVVVTQPKPGEFKAFSAICTHQGCKVTSIEGGTINCPCHASKFSIADGSVKAPPATKPLPAKEIKVTGDQISLA
ncbi:Ferredoxin subunit of nitrite reductase or a ring-hydroxylating dioxygenase [Micromonospora rhizosphaerae]|uniref:Cytochrome bc1 complex Rieske iron-sulfur subunit n=1 Tax=Micromonospora rhizosphaerae TaxID=568872 RepID=A0A1C6T5P9_9ACTN|nr:Rieske (2Fe-2S) protein [Micromonospora rhizosphaerae]SCL37108.1 Ferredoxin subunit of nitrite reductase or a ring-hydroxylating dioxygenase [Micromonospora rhizosphaerae]